MKPNRICFYITAVQFASQAFRQTEQHSVLLRCPSEQLRENINSVLTRTNSYSIVVQVLELLTQMLLWLSR